MKGPKWRWPRRMACVVAGLVGLVVTAHATIGFTTKLTPPIVQTTKLVRDDHVDGSRRAGRGWSKMFGGLRVVSLSGPPEDLGSQHTALLADRMVANESVLWDGFEHIVPFAPARALMFDVGLVRYRAIDANFPEERRRELAAQAAAFSPDPYAHHLPTYTRMAMLHALYDIALGFEGSPLLGCTAFGLSPERTASGHALFGRAFDFEAADVFDRDKVVFVVNEDGRVPFASVAWPGLVGVVTGMNSAGVAVAVHGGRAREPSSRGTPVAFSLRAVLERAHDTAEAIEILDSQAVMVSHIVFVGDAAGRFAVVERAPGARAHVRESFAQAGRASITNHFEGPLAGDPRDVRVRAQTTTLARRARIDELLAKVEPRSATVESSVRMLRDHKCAGGQSCLLGDRRTIDAFIATHGVVFDLTDRTMWVSEGPHLSGRFVKLELERLVKQDAPVETGPLESIAADPVLTDGGYEEGRARAGGPMLGERK